MSIIHSSTRVVRKFALKGKTGNRRTYSQVSEPIFRVEQHATSLTQTHSGSSGWAFPATLAIIGLGFSLFCTKQVVTCNGTIKAFAQPTKKSI
ncbi:unnamed protein product [Lymnaea stagnalis]|uniref:Uncharacterized protein n=1 Tax=Lymnaea stagnalis TaxID=6523 RepID=A0AAV2H4P7_LYMST